MTNEGNIPFVIQGLNPKTSIVSIEQHVKQMSKDGVDSSNKGLWTHARNAVNNSHSGDYLVLGNEPSNKNICRASYTIIGLIYLSDNIWVVFSTLKTHPQDTTYANNPTNSGCEIGLFNLNNLGSSTQQVYIPIIDDYKLNFCQTHIIYGTSRKNSFDEYVIYWDDGLNPTRYLNLGNPERWSWGQRNPKLHAWCDNTYIPVKYVMTNPLCQTPTPQIPLQIDLEKIKIVPDIKAIKIYGRQDKNNSGTLPNGIYQVFAAYVREGHRISDYFASEIIHVYSDSGSGGSLYIELQNVESENVREYELVIASFVAEQYVAKHIGIYSTEYTTHSIDTIHPTSKTVPLEELLLITNKYQYSDICCSVANFLLRISPHEHFEINYQPLANLIIPKFVVCEVPADYYEESGNKVGYMRDEVYSFFIRWIYNDGNKTPAYIIPAPPANVNINITGYNNTNSISPNVIIGNNTYLSEDNKVVPKFIGNVKTHISTEKYDSNNNLRYDLHDYLNDLVYVNAGNNFLNTTEYFNISQAINRYVQEYNDTLVTGTIPVPSKTNICDANIRLIKMPSELDACEELKLYDAANNKIRILGITFDNIVHPIDNYGRFIPNIQGYEILRSDRNGNKTIIAKGIVNNYGEYKRTNNSLNTSFGVYSNGLASQFSMHGHGLYTNYLYQNYPLNDLRPNHLLTFYETRYTSGSFLKAFNFAHSLGRIIHSMSDITNPNVLKTPCPDYVIPEERSSILSLLLGFYSNIVSSYVLNFPYSACRDEFHHKKFSSEFLSFHSPDTVFKKPYLTISQMTVYSLYEGAAKTIYVLPQKHPKQKLLKKITEFFALLTAIGMTTIKLNGRKTIKSSAIRFSGGDVAAHSVPDIVPATSRIISRVATVIPVFTMAMLLSRLERNNAILGLNTVGTTTLGIINTFNNIRDLVGIISSIAGGATYTTPEIVGEETEFNVLPKIMRQLLFMPYFLTNLSTSLSSIRQLFLEMVSFRDYALHTVTQCTYYPSSYLCRQNTLKRNYDIANTLYISNQNTTINDFDYGIVNVMNKDRNRHVLLKIKKEEINAFENVVTQTLKTYNIDTSRFRMLDLLDKTCDINHEENKYIFNTNIRKWILFCNNPTNHLIESNSKVLYCGIKVSNDNVYGRLYNNKLLLVGVPQIIPDTRKIYISDVLFGGDIYIGRYSEKNPFFYFDDYPQGMPDGVEYNYLLQRTILYPRYWLSTQLNILESVLEAYPNALCNQTYFISLLTGSPSNLETIGDEFQQPDLEDSEDEEGFKQIIRVIKGLVNKIKDIAAPITNIINSLANPTAPNHNLWNILLDNINTYNLDGNVYQWVSLDVMTNIFPGEGKCNAPAFGALKGVWFYLSHIGIREFFVESEVNLAFRQLGDTISEKFYHYKKYSSLYNFTNEDIIRLEDYYKYDWSLSASKYYSVLGSFSTIQRRDYDCILADILQGPRKNMVIYSLPQNNQNIKDNWHIFLPLNYKIFEDDITNIKALNNSGAIIFFKNSSPVFFAGVDTLSTESGIKLTIGDGGLFAQPLQKSTISDNMYEYGSLQNKQAVINTPYGIYFFSIDQDKIFQYNNAISEISNTGVRWWLTRFSKFNLLEQVDNYDILDNSVIGIGASASFDNQNGIIYFHKTDYKIKDEFFLRKDYKFEYKKGTGLFEVYKFTANGWILIDVVNVHNENYFKDVSWTLSYDPKIKAFISFHDWHPNLVGGSQDTFFTVKDNSIYLHNADCTSYCNFYGKQYPFEVEYETSSNLQVTTLRNIEYILEVYKYSDNCTDRFHVLDENFNEMVVYNSEQCTGLMKLFLTPKNNPIASLQYPEFTATGVNVLYSKEEQKYRVNTLLDIVRDRGEYSLAEDVIWHTEENGYVKNLNPNAIDYNKHPTERKKMRHYKNRIFLRKVFGRGNNNYKFLFIISFIKKLYSSR